MSPFTVLGPWHDLEKQLREAQEEIPHTVGPAQEGCQARIDQIEAERAAAAGAARLGYKQRFGRRKKAPSPAFWYNAPVRTSRG